MEALPGDILYVLTSYDNMLIEKIDMTHIVSVIPF